MNEEGSTYVVGAGDEYELLGVNRLEGFAMASPALVGDGVLVRTQSRIYSIRDDGDG